MKYRYIALVTFLVLTLAVMPATAFTAKNLVIAIQDNGDATINFNYQLSWMEQFMYKMIPAKEHIVQSALASKFPSITIENIQVSDSTTSLTARSFAGTSNSGGSPVKTTYTTPAVSFMMAQDLLNNFPGAWAITPDFSPDLTVVQFPDGQQYTYTDGSGIPAISYSVTK